LYGRSRIRR